MTALTSPSWARVDGPLAPYADGFRAELERLGYTPLTAATHVRLMAHLSRWLAPEGRRGAGVDPGGGRCVLRRAPRGRVCRACHWPGSLDQHAPTLSPLTSLMPPYLYRPTMQVVQPWLIRRELTWFGACLNLLPAP